MLSVWQSEERRCAVVLHEVFGWLAAGDLARAGAACRSWRRAAAEPSLWRRLLRPVLQAPHAGARVAWRQEYVWSHAGWRLRARHRAADTLLHAALAPPDLLALAGADASLAVWQRERQGEWREAGRTCLRARGWGAVARAVWAGRERLLLAGPLALADDWELIVLRVEEDGRCGSVASRVRCSAGAAGCWVDATGDAFLSFELRRLGSGLYCTTVWLNAATQARAGGRRRPARCRSVARATRGSGLPARRLAAVGAAPPATAGSRGRRPGRALAAPAPAPRRARARAARARRGGRARCLHAARVPRAPARVPRRARPSRAREVHVGRVQ